MKLAPLTTDIAPVLAADHWDVAERLYRLAAAAGTASELDLSMARALLDAPWDEVSPEHVGPGTLAPRTAEVAYLLATGRRASAAYVAEFECEDADLVDVWMVGVLVGS